MAFTPFKQWAEQDTEAYIIANSQTLTIGDAVQFAGAAGSGGFLSGAASTTTAVYGVVVGFTTSPGGSVAQDTLMIAPSGSYAAAANNQTLGMVRARVLPARQSRLFIADLSQTAGTTTGSGDPGFFSMASTNGKLTETSYVVQTATALQFFSVGSGYASSNNGPTGLFPVTSTQVIGFFTNSKTV